MYPSEKTIPYRPSPAELENLRILRRRMNSSGQDDLEETSEEGNTWQPYREPITQKVDKKTS